MSKVLQYKVAAFGTLPREISDEARANIIKAIESALLPLQRQGIYLTNMFYKTEEINGEDNPARADQAEA